MKRLHAMSYRFGCRGQAALLRALKIVLRCLGGRGSIKRLHLTALRDHNVLNWLSFRICNSPRVLDFRNHIHTFNDIAKDNMLAVQMRCTMLCSDDEELATICLDGVRAELNLFL